MMKFTVELFMNDRVFTKRYVTAGLHELHQIVAKEFPKARIMSIFGGPS